MVHEADEPAPSKSTFHHRLTAIDPKLSMYKRALNDDEEKMVVEIVLSYCNKGSLSKQSNIFDAIELPVKILPEKRSSILNGKGHCPGCKFFKYFLVGT